MDQFGCPKSRNPKARDAGTGGPPDGTYKNLVTGATETRSNGGNIKDEHPANAKISNEPGTLSMANTGAPNSGGSQARKGLGHGWGCGLEFWVGVGKGVANWSGSWPTPPVGPQARKLRPLATRCGARLAAPRPPPSPCYGLRFV